MRKASIKTLLEYTPYDNKCPSPFGIRENENDEEEKFYSNHLFVDYPQACKKIRNDLSKYIEEQTIHLIIFSGSSGSGKTTFLKNYFRNKKEEYHSRYVNLVEYPSPIGNDRIIATTLKAGLKTLLSKNVANTLYETYRDWCEKKSTVNLSFFLPSELDTFMSFCESYSQDDASQIFEVEMNKFDFYRNGDLIQLLSLYLITSIIPFKNDDKSFVFVFDNLDEVDKHYISSVLSTTINTSYSFAQVYCEEVLRYNFIWNVTFLLSVRMENQRYLRVSDIQERTDILHKNPKPLEFSQDYQAAYSDILNARLRYYENNCRDDKPNEFSIEKNYENINKLLHSEEVFFKRFIKPLYSYDYRMFTHFAISDLLQEESLFIPESLISLDAGNDCHQGARGMLLFYSLAGLLGHNMSRFYSYVKEEFSQDICNVFRMSFTLLSNLSGWSRREEGLMELLEDKDDFNERTKQVDMPLFIDAIEKWYKDKKELIIPRVLEGLIGTSANSFECPILLFGNAIDDYIISLGDRFSVAALANKIVQDYLNNRNSLSSVSIQIHPLCIVYSARVFIHYEYFNLISPVMKEANNHKFDYKPKPLFQFVDLENDDEKDNIEKCLLYTYETAISIINKADNHFCRICEAQNIDNCLGECKTFINEFKKDGFSFNNTIHATRIISAHIHYLDNYRHFLWHRIGTKEYHSVREIEMQKIIIERILEYIAFYKKRKVRDDLYETITDYWKGQYENAIASLNVNPQKYNVINLEIKKR